MFLKLLMEIIKCRKIKDSYCTEELKSNRLFEDNEAPKGFFFTGQLAPKWRRVLKSILLFLAIITFSAGIALVASFYLNGYSDRMNMFALISSFAGVSGGLFITSGLMELHEVVYGYKVGGPFYKFGVYLRERFSTELKRNPTRISNDSIYHVTMNNQQILNNICAVLGTTSLLGPDIPIVVRWTNNTVSLHRIYCEMLVVKDELDKMTCKCDKAEAAKNELVLFVGEFCESLHDIHEQHKLLHGNVCQIKE